MQKLLLIYNPASGKGRVKANLSAAVDVFTKRGWLVTAYPTQGVACLDLPNDRLGGPSGFDFGDLLVTVGGDPAYTGIVSNGVTGAVLYFDNGFCKGTPQ